MSNELSMMLGGALVQTLSPLPALTASASEATANTKLLTEKALAYLAVGEKVAIAGAVAVVGWIVWKNTRPRVRPAYRRRRPRMKSAHG
jgi:hypothetical protein